MLSSYVSANENKWPKKIQDEQACIYHTVLTVWDSFKDTLVLNANQFNSSPFSISSFHSNFQCQMTYPSKDSILYLRKTSSDSWSNIKAYWFVCGYDTSLLMEKPHLFQKKQQISDFTVFEFDFDYPL